MKTLKYIFRITMVFLLLGSCTEDANDLSFIDSVVAPTEVSAVFKITQDNTGLVTITPNAVGASNYNITYGDATTEAVNVIQGESTSHIYEEGTYSVKIEAVGLSGLKSEVTKELLVSFKAPENLVVTIENDPAISKQVNVTATADFAVSFEVYFGETVENDLVIGNIGDTVNYTYQDAGTYTIRIVVMGGAIETTEYTEEFIVTAILQPLASAKAPPFRQVSDVIGVFSDKLNYEYDLSNDFFPYWDQGADWNVGEFLIDEDKILRYTGLTYQGIQLAANIDASGMEFLHIDIWTADDNNAKLSPISASTGEKAFDLDLTANQWTSFDIPLSYFTDLGLSMADIAQFKFDGAPAGGTIFVDNIYFWRAPSSYTPLLFDDFEGNGNITLWAGDQAGMDNAFVNPYVNANNFSETVLEYKDTGGQYANVQFVADGKFDLSGGKSVFSLKVYVPSTGITGAQENKISLKLQNSELGPNVWQTQTEIIKPIVLDTWQVITFDFENDDWINLNFNGIDPDPVDRLDLDKVVIQVNGENNFDNVTAYIDDFNYGTTPPADSPPFARDGFEGNGTITTWFGDSAGLNTAFANPFVDANNNSATVLEYQDTGGQYANVQFTVSPKFDLVAKSKFTLKVYVPSSGITGSQENKISLKLQNSELGPNVWQTQTEIIKPILLDTWQEITFDFVNDDWVNLNFNGIDPDPIDRTDLDKVVIQVNGENNFDNVVAYIDNFNYHN
ncbi:PKD domain-containing protein [Thalassobellus sediminis]|uniref:PKD domain-containing protein n=1 Tax=Thalassobellus sediminis TaxID=3367753 RepID=UPI00379ACA42